MSTAGRIDEEDLHAYIDGELDPARSAAIDVALTGDPAMAARVAAFRADKQRLSQIFGPVAQRKLPAAWLARIDAERVRIAAPRWSPRSLSPRKLSSSNLSLRNLSGPWLAAIAACLLLAVVGGGVIALRPPSDTILADAAAAHDGTLHADTVLAGDALPAEAARDHLLRATLGMNVRAPDLSRFGYRLVSLDIFRQASRQPAAGLVYRNSRATDLTIYVHRSAGQARFDLLRRGRFRVCIWQDDVVGAVMTGEMSAGEMMRVASRAYADLNL